MPAFFFFPTHLPGSAIFKIMKVGQYSSVQKCHKLTSLEALQLLILNIYWQNMRIVSDFLVPSPPICLSCKAFFPLLVMIYHMLPFSPKITYPPSFYGFVFISECT